MKHHASDAHTLAAAYALNALDPSERKDFDAHLQDCEACRQEVAEFQATAARLSAAVAREPSAASKPAIMAAIDGVRQLPPRVATTAPATTLGAAVRRRAVPLALAATVAAAASLGGLAVWQRQHSDDLQQRAEQAEQRLDDASLVLAAPDAQTVHGRTTNGALTTVVASEQLNKAVFTASGLPAPAAGKTYQLWLDHDGSMHPAGFITGDGTVQLSGSPADAHAIGLSLEPVGGSPQPTTKPLLLMALPS
ncbi:anti-sigma factor domain-containing protein [Streptomyces sp. NPDC059650]|uniref:anti-sigma factor n=1 Tax=Streptomyces sp. NPDC059650 TaxID=3346896 RepID=UPI00369A6604